ncbi:uncharacterized protein HKW66_Vig0168280 [Vigna angularis]|uniref:Uncharacterized protein n=1 Tax=Phaseolus angularis TaxID=3914 RepID=A0A8T0JT00_PHAAN|nr:uncharacterized protein HKW66_Vig0168280 [Vigna angularis]
MSHNDVVESVTKAITLPYVMQWLRGYRAVCGLIRVQEQRNDKERNGSGVGLFRLDSDKPFRPFSSRPCIPCPGSNFETDLNDTMVFTLAIASIAQKAEREASDLKGTMRKRMEFLDFE